MREELKRSGLLFLLGLLAFAGLGLELLLAFFVEPMIYGTDMSEWTSTQNIMHWVMTCLIWILVAAVLVIVARRKLNFDVFKRGENLSVWSWFWAIVLIVIIGIISYWDWNGFKVIKEYNYHGPILFSFQYLYYLVEMILVVLIVAFAQESGEQVFNSKYVPYGGIFLALSWGMIHALTKGSLLIGVLSAVVALIIGRIYVLMGKDVRKAYPLIFIAFII